MSEGRCTLHAARRRACLTRGSALHFPGGQVWAGLRGRGRNMKGTLENSAKYTDKGDLSRKFCLLTSYANTHTSHLTHIMHKVVLSFWVSVMGQGCRRQ